MCIHRVKRSANDRSDSRQPGSKRRKKPAGKGAGDSCAEIELCAEEFRENDLRGPAFATSINIDHRGTEDAEASDEGSGDSEGRSIRNQESCGEGGVGVEGDDFAGHPGTAPAEEGAPCFKGPAEVEDANTEAGEECGGGGDGVKRARSERVDEVDACGGLREEEHQDQRPVRMLALGFNTPDFGDIFFGKVARGGLGVV